jgi:type I restriction-modification system DNA methylase subunit
MILTDEQKKAIEKEYNEWVAVQYAGKSKADRQELGQFYTPASLTIRMIEKFENLEGPIIDPCSGSGALLAGCIMAGADPKNIFAIELDRQIYEKVLIPHLTKLGVPKENIRRGDALDPKAWDFNSDYKYFDPEEIKEKKGMLGFFGNIKSR